MILSADKNKYSPPEYNVLKNVNSTLPLVLITRLDDYEFNTELLNLKEYVLIDFSELGWDKEFKDSHIFGKNTSDFKYRFDSPEWDKLDGWVKNNPPKYHFIREILKKDITDTVLPIDYPCYATPYPVENREHFNSRPVNVFNFWGRSSEDRVKVHAEFWTHSSVNGASICDNMYYINKFLNEEHNPNKWVTLNIPHFSRVDIQNIYNINGLSKLSLSLKGCGNKCFRHGESPVNSIMVMEDNGITFAYEWVHGVNCIKFKGDPISAIEQALKRDDLYDIYLRGLENIDKYRIDNYTKNYIEKIINT